MHFHFFPGWPSQVPILPVDDPIFVNNSDPSREIRHPYGSIGRNLDSEMFARRGIRTHATCHAYQIAIYCKWRERMPIILSGILAVAYYSLKIQQRPPRQHRLFLYSVELLYLYQIDTDDR
jgi:hypothetical protein